MSGGHFDYKQHTLSDIADEIDQIIIANGVENEFGYTQDYSEETIERFNSCVQFLRIASAMVQRIDYLICGDDGEETFGERWAEDLDALLRED